MKRSLSITPSEPPPAAPQKGSTMYRSVTSRRGILRRLGVGTVLVLAGTVLSACGGSDPEEEPSEEASETSAAPEEGGLIAIITPSHDNPFFKAEALGS